MRAGAEPRAESAIQASVVARPLAALLRGPIQPARVVGVYPMAAYLAVGAQLIALTARDAERLPFGVQVRVTSRGGEPLLGLAVGARAMMGAGAIVFDAPPLRIEIGAAAVWDPRPTADGIAADPAVVRARVDELAERLAVWARPDSLAALLAVAHEEESPRGRHVIRGPIVPAWCRGEIHRVRGRQAASPGQPITGPGRACGRADAIIRVDELVRSRPEAAGACLRARGRDQSRPYTGPGGDWPGRSKQRPYTAGRPSLFGNLHTCAPAANAIHGWWDTLIAQAQRTYPAWERGGLARPAGAACDGDAVAAVAVPGGADYRVAVWAGLAVFGRAVCDGDASGVERAARGLVGLGPGLTPAGDDVLGGLLAAGRFVARLCGDDEARVGGEEGARLASGDVAHLAGEGVARWRRVGRIVRRTARGRTTAVSEALLAYASIGMVGESVGALLRALGAPSAAPLGRALGRTLALGHTSGADIALGVLLGARLELSMLSGHAGGGLKGR
jgi:hypothetical protein